MRIIAAVFFVLFFCSAARSDDHIFLYAGAGTALHFPGTLRAGYGNWEAGRLTTASYGIDKLFRLENNFYAAFGPVISPGGLGFYGAFGVECDLFWGLTFRGEMNAIADMAGFTRGELSAGLGLHF